MTAGSPEPTAIWADVDTGVDDALALLYLVADPGVELVGVSAVAGNVGVELVVANTLALLDTVGAESVPVHRGAASPLLGPHRDATHFHGASGLGDTVLPESARSADPLPAIDALRAAVTARPGSLTLLALGPLTNVALFLAAYPDEARKLGRVIAMSGALASGNATASAEFNCWHDPEAAQIVLESGVPVTIFPLESFDIATLPLSVAERWQDSPVAARALASAFLRHCTSPGAEEALIGDGAVACVAARPDLAVTRTLPVAIDLAPGISRGRLVVDRRDRTGEHEQHGGAPLPSTAEVVIAVSRGALADQYVRALEQVDGATASGEASR